jgi:type VI secretion system protein ImpH
VAAPCRRTDPSIEESLFERGYEFEFFQAVRLLARLYPDRRPVGSTAKPADEIVRFGASTVDSETGKPICMEFPPSAVHEIEPVPGAPDPVRMTVAFMGLTGTQGVLPFYYTERMLARKIAKDGAMAAFFDLFNHRFVSLFYRAWQKYRHPVLYESAGDRIHQPDAFTHSLLDLIGMGTDGLRGRMRMHDESLLLYAGLIAQRPHSASALRGILRDYFSVPVEIDQCLGSWYEIEDQDRCYLNTELERCQLGEAAFLGDGVWNQQARFRIHLGPLGLEQFLKFLPDGEVLPRLVELTTYIAGQAMLFDVQVSLRADEVPYCRLDDEGWDAPRLGWMGWLKTGEFVADAGDAVFGWVN